MLRYVVDHTAVTLRGGPHSGRIVVALLLSRFFILFEKHHRLQSFFLCVVISLHVWECTSMLGLITKIKAPMTLMIGISYYLLRFGPSFCPFTLKNTLRGLICCSLLPDWPIMGYFIGIFRKTLGKFNNILQKMDTNGPESAFLSSFGSFF